MALKGSAWCNRFRVEWAEGNTDLEFLSDAGWRLKIMEGGVLIFEAKPSPSGAFRVVAPHTWTSLRTSPIKPMGLSSSGWTGSAYTVWASDLTHGPQPTPEVQMKMMGGGMLVFDEEEGGGVLVFAPHAWKSLHTAFDFTK